MSANILKNGNAADWESKVRAEATSRSKPAGAKCGHCGSTQVDAAKHPPNEPATRVWCAICGEPTDLDGGERGDETENTSEGLRALMAEDEERKRDRLRERIETLEWEIAELERGPENARSDFQLRDKDNRLRRLRARLTREGTGQ